MEETMWELQRTRAGRAFAKNILEKPGNSAKMGATHCDIIETTARTLERTTHTTRVRRTSKNLWIHLIRFSRVLFFSTTHLVAICKSADGSLHFSLSSQRSAVCGLCIEPVSTTTLLE
jgi:hypothetical protein